MTTTEANKDVIRKWFAVFNSGDFSGLGRIHSEHCRNHAPGPFDISPWPQEGKEFGPGEFRGTVEWVRRSQPDIHVRITGMVAEGDEVVAFVESTGTATGAGGPFPATGARIDFSQSHRFRVQDGAIVEHWAVRDDLRSMIQAGVVEPPRR